MTSRQLLEAALIECNKVNAPSLLLEDYNYFINKAINQYTNKSYNLYDINQQYSDNLRVLKSSAILTPTKTTLYDEDELKSLFGETHEIELPGDYLHMLNCVCVYKLKQQYKCYNNGSYQQFPATRLTADTWSKVMHNYYNRPSYKKPYYYIHNVNTVNDGSLPTNPYDITTGQGTDFNKCQELILQAIVDGKIQQQDLEFADVPSSENLNPDRKVNFELTYNKLIKDETIKSYFDSITVSNLPRTVKIGVSDESLVEKNSAIRIGNPVNSIRCEIRYGNDSSTFELVKVLVDYIKVPQYVRITQEQMDTIQDNSQIMEFPDYVCQEIINELVHLIMENASDPRLQTHIPVTQSIANPTQQQAQSNN